MYLKKVYQKEEFESISIVSICQRTINTINCAQEGASLISKQWAVKKKMRICFIIKATRTKWIPSILKAMFEFILTQVT